MPAMHASLFSKREVVVSGNDHHGRLMYALNNNFQLNLSCDVAGT